MRSGTLEQWFPALRSTDYEVTSPYDEGYNCIAHAAKDSDAWWWPCADGYWPGDSLDDSIENFVKIFCEFLRYEDCRTPELEHGYEKVAIYAIAGHTKHMARQLPDGQWTSKLGKAQDISHALSGVQGESYGFAVRFLRRKITEP